MNIEKVNLGSFENEDVVQATVQITNAGDGLSKALAVHPTLLHRKDKVHVVLECEVTKIQFGALGDTDVLVRIHTLKAGSATLIDESAVRAALDATNEAIEKAEGIHKLPGMASTDTDPPDNPDQNGAGKPAKAAAKKAPAAKKTTGS